ncbi:single-stranded DNA-binding protein [Dietzia cinnamea]|uniref:single-stranded DNA-binding protein n=1 Tax=Dietzia cinnamea TaxID=321318 RepID=UPI0021A3EB28|nr:single-stranded DNA-binding protein [Dietzia cinnamea]MCT2121568.1 single-stranded DNA-binding protein [Dietzia cinnamea]
MSNSMSIKGRAGSDGELRFTPSGVASCSFSVADTPRKKDQSGNWVDAGPTLWQRVQVWGPEAEKAAEEVRKGSLVTVSGRVKADEWTDKQTGETRKSTTLVADVVYVHPPKESQGQQRGGFQGPQQGQADPWGSSPAFGDSSESAPF